VGALILFMDRLGLTLFQGAEEVLRQIPGNHEVSSSWQSLDVILYCAEGRLQVRGL